MLGNGSGTELGASKLHSNGTLQLTLPLDARCVYTLSCLTKNDRIFPMIPIGTNTAKYDLSIASPTMRYFTIYLKLIQIQIKSVAVT